MNTAAKTVRNCRRPPSAVVIGCSALFGGLERQCNPRDVVLTKPRIAEMIVRHFKPSGRVLDPCRGTGAFWKHMTGAEWCEIEEGRDFLEWKTPMDWIVSNPPYSNFWDFLAHSFTLSENVVYLIPLHKIWSSQRYMDAIREYGGIRETLIIGGGKVAGFTMGFPVGAVHFQRKYRGEMRVSYPPNSLIQPTPLA